MKEKTVAALLALNFLITGGLSALLLTKFQGMSLTGDSDPVPVQVDLSGIDQPLSKVSKDLDQLTSSIQRFNTSLVQYDFLKREMDRLAALDQNIGMRAQVAASQKNDENTKEIEDVLAKLNALSGKVKGEQQVRRQTMLKLISNLEKQLAEISPPVPIQPKPPVTPPATPSPAPVPVPEAAKPAPVPTNPVPAKPGNTEATPER
jgi:hypothetical protein